MKKLLTLLMVLLLGLGVGGGAAYGLALVLGPPPAPDAHIEHKKVETAFVPTGALVAPIVTGDGNLSGYASFEMQLEVAEADEAEVTAQIPLLLHAINMRTYRTPMAAGKQKILPDLDVLSRIAMEAATSSLGKGKVVRVVVMSARPM